MPATSGTLSMLLTLDGQQVHPSQLWTSVRLGLGKHFVNNESPMNLSWQTLTQTRTPKSLSK
jgi:hypothetical protein